MTADPPAYDGFKGTTYSAAVVDRVLVVSCSEVEHRDDEYDRYCALITRHQVGLRAQVVFSRGGGPSASQRQRGVAAVTDEHVRKNPPPTAVLTESAMVRGLMTIFNWFFSKTFKAFRPDEVSAAMAHAKLDADTGARALAVEAAIRPD